MDAAAVQVKELLGHPDQVPSQSAATVDAQQDTVPAIAAEQMTDAQQDTVQLAVSAAAIAAEQMLLSGGGEITRAAVEAIAAGFSEKMMELAHQSGIPEKRAGDGLSPAQMPHQSSGGAATPSAMPAAAREPQQGLDRETLTRVLTEFVEGAYAMKLCDELRVQPLIGAPRHTRIGVVFSSVFLADTSGPAPKLEVKLHPQFEQRSERLLEHLVAHLQTSMPKLERLQYDAKSPPSTRTILIKNQRSRRAR